MIKAVIFDLDDLMIDSEIYYFEAMDLLLNRHGKSAPQAWFGPMIGLDNYQCAEYVIENAQLPLTPVEYINETQNIMIDFIPKMATPNPGLLELIDDLLGLNMKLGVASNSFRTYVRLTLEELGIIDFFSCIFSADDVVVGKPEPEIYLLAAQCLGVPPKHCLALEDSPSGMTAALAAGMSCVVIPNSHIKEADFTGAMHVFQSLVELRKTLPAVLNNHKGRISS